MRISIWQQFSSNHSGFFWVAGTFKSIDEARVAYGQLRQILFEIDRWHREHKDESAAALISGYKSLPPESAFALQYNVDWPATIDWTNFADYRHDDHPAFKSVRPAQERSEELIDEAVSTIGRVVIISNPDQTWMGVQPFQALLERFGAETIGMDMESELPEDFELHPIIRFTAPDALTADNIESAFRDYLSRLAASDNSDPVPPWHDDEANFREIVGKSKLVRQEDIETIQRNWKRQENLHNRLPSIYGQRILAQRLALRRPNVIIVRKDLNFTLIDMWFHNEPLAISALIAYLEMQGCTGIDFEYSTRPLLD
jgi:hypothetical protein